MSILLSRLKKGKQKHRTKKFDNNKSKVDIMFRGENQEGSICTSENHIHLTISCTRVNQSNIQKTNHTLESKKVEKLNGPQEPYKTIRTTTQQTKQLQDKTDNIRKPK